MAKIIKIPSAYVMDTKVVGVSHPNPDGTSRQAIIANEIHEEDILRLVPEPNNPYDENAVKVVTQTGLQIGYLSKEIAGKVQQAILNDISVKAIVSWVSERDIKGVGLRIEMVN